MGTNPFKTAQAKVDDQSRRCGFCDAIASLSPTRRKQLKGAFLDKSISGKTIVTVLAGWGVGVSSTAVTDHRSGRQTQCADKVAKNWSKR